MRTPQHIAKSRPAPGFLAAFSSTMLPGDKMTPTARRLALRLCAFAAALTALLFAAGPAASPAQAAPPTLWTACNGGEADIQCSIPRGVAANPLNGRVYAADQINRRIVEFTALGSFVKTWGWDVIASGPGDDVTAPEDQFEICVPGNGDTCKAGSSGSGVGQFNGTQGIAVDSSGNVYVVEVSNRRVQKFDATGNFQLMIGGEVNETSGGNVCPRPGFPADTCKAAAAASGGSDPGEFGTLAVGSYIAVDDNGTEAAADDIVYVGDQERIQRFDTEGVYQGEIATPGETVQSLAVDPAGNLYTINIKPGLAGKIFKLSPSGEPLPPSFELKTPDGKPSIPTAVAVDPAGNVYAFGPISFSGGQKLDPIFEFDPAGNLIDNFGKDEFNGSTGLATNLCAGSEAPGNLYVTNASIESAFLRAYGTPPTGCLSVITGEATAEAETAATLNGAVNPKGLAVTECGFRYGTTTAYGETAPCAEEGAIGTGSDPIPVHAEIAGLQKGTVYHFRLAAELGGATEEGDDATFKTLGPPVISNDHTAGATDTQATLEALVNPEGFATTYLFQYGPSSAYGQATTTIPLPADRKDHAATVVLEGLTPGATYHWRIVASNSSGTTSGEDHAFTAYRSFVAEEGCPNQVFRSGPSALLPDCRAYEMVSPVDKNGNNIIVGLSGTADPAGYVQVSADGEKIAYTSIGSFAGEPNNFAANQYLASREAGVGWSSEGIHPSAGGDSAAPAFRFGYAREFMAFTPDLCSAWMEINQTPPPTADGQLGYPNLYRRDNCDPGAGALKALTASPPALPGSTPLGYVDNTSVQGISADGSRAFFVARGGPLPGVAGANAGTNRQIYERTGGSLVVASVLPSGNATTEDAEVGSGWNHNLENAVSADGERLYWTAGIGNPGEGRIFMRRHPELGPGADDCADPARACTRAVSGPLPAFFWAASPDGAKALYSEINLSGGKDLYRFSVNAAGEAQPRELIASEVEGVLGQSEDLSRVYFVSREKIAGSGENSHEDEASEGEPNVYLAEGGATRFVGTLVEGDVGQLEPEKSVLAYNLISSGVYERATRVSPDGRHLSFESRAPLTGFDNRDASSGEPAVEVFAYEAGGELRCVSCAPSGARPRSGELPIPYRTPGPGAETGVPAAAWIPTWEHPLNASGVMSEDGRRIFFNSNDKLLPRDSNGAQDVYEWEAPGSGSCETASPSFFSENGGCIYLISSGESRFESIFWEASPDGRDAFFTTASSLLPQDPGLIDLYDARAGGGLPEPVLAASCEGEACQSPPEPPNDPTPASSSFEGAGNVVEVPAKPKCKRGKVRRHGRCVAKRHKRAKRHHHRANRDRRTAR